MKMFALVFGAVSAVLLGVHARAETLLSDFDNFFFFDDQYGSWLSDFPTPKATNWTISASGFGGGVVGFYEEDGFTPKVVDASGDGVLELQVTIESTNVPPDIVTAGPLVLLQDGDGTRWRWAWYGLSAGSYILEADLGAGYVQEAAGTNAGLELTNLVLFHIQVDPGGDPDPYTITLENLRTYPSPPPSCDTLISDFDNTGLLGGFGTWETNLPPPQPDNWTITLNPSNPTNNFGGGFQNISPNVNGSGETTVELSLTVTNTPAEVTPRVLLQDADGTQWIWQWPFLTNGSYILTGNLSVPDAVGIVGLNPGFNVSNIDWFQLHVDPGTNVTPYTIIFENLRLFGFNPTITRYAFDPAVNQFDLTWLSRTNRAYSISYVSDLTGEYSVLASNLLSGGSSTTNSVVVPTGEVGFIKVFEQCE